MNGATARTIGGWRHVSSRPVVRMAVGQGTPKVGIRGYVSPNRRQTPGYARAHRARPAPTAATGPRAEPNGNRPCKTPATKRRAASIKKSKAKAQAAGL